MGRLVLDLMWWLACRGWRAARALSGDDAYERYLEAMPSTLPGAPPMARSRFFQERLATKWNRLASCGRCFER
jgi:uncharacterized short protein YbdD (DUF466 family)